MGFGDNLLLFRLGFFVTGSLFSCSLFATTNAGVPGCMGTWVTRVGGDVKPLSVTVRSSATSTKALDGHRARVPVRTRAAAEEGGLLWERRQQDHCRTRRRLHRRLQRTGFVPTTAGVQTKSGMAVALVLVGDARERPRPCSLQVTVVCVHSACSTRIRLAPGSNSHTCAQANTS